MGETEGVLAEAMSVDDTTRVAEGALTATVELDAVVPSEFNGERVDFVAAKLFAEVSRSEISRWIRAGLLTVDGRAVKPKTKVRGGERILARAARAPRFDWRAAQPIDFDVLYRDESFIVVDKPAGLVVHPGAGNARGTLVNGLLQRWPGLGMLPRAGLIHRLDKDTSGVMVVAANDSSQKTLVAAMSERRVERHYLAVAEGRMIADQRVDLALGRDPRNRLRQAVRADGRPAVTHFSVRKRYAAHTLLAARLETGRTHQVRVHAAASGHPLVGDRRYGARGIVPPQADGSAAEVVRGFPRQALHAHRLAFEHPASGEAMAFESPLPDDLAELLRALES